MLATNASTLSARRATVELVFSAFLWGFAFICAKWSLMAVGPLWTNSLRFLLAFGCAFPVILLSAQLRAHASWRQARLAFLPGIYLAGALVLQLYGLGYTTVTKSSFITVLYIVFVPLLEKPFLGTRVPWWHSILVLVALLGAALICELHTGDWNRGDLLTLGCAVVSACHILQLTVVKDQVESSFVFNVYQALWAGVLPTMLALFLEPLPALPIPAISVIGILLLAFASTLLAFAIQVRSQRVLSPTVVSMLFLLESPVAAGFAWIIFGESFSPAQWLGALLILVAAIGTIRFHVLW